MVHLADLPENRREALLWYHVLELDYDGIDDLVAAGADQPCRWDWHGDFRDLVAVLGDDGRYHLRNGSEVLCGRERCRRPGAYLHDQWYGWWAEDVQYRMQPPRGTDLQLPEHGHGSRDVQWIVRLGDTVSAPDLVPPAQRCPVTGCWTLWPAFANTTTPRGRLRALLIAEFGSLCQGCRLAPSSVIDHDHFTGQIRALLCYYCNGRVDRCVHISGCPWADYLNAPPAVRLQLTMPNRGKRLTTKQLKRVEYLGFNPLSTRQ